MSTLAPGWALNAQAIDAAGDPLLRPGIHFRVVPSAVLGLPAAPFQVSRVALGQHAANATLRHDITWKAPDGTTLTPPFDPAAYGGQVIGYLPAPGSGICCWIEVDATPSPGIIGNVIDSVREITSRAGGLIGIAPIARRPAPGRLVIEAGVTTPRGRAVVARRALPLYDLAAARIDHVIARGHGQIRGVSWVDARTVAGGGVWRTLALPHGGGARYLGIANPVAEADTRLQRGAPLRQGLHDDPTAASASATPSATAADEATRLSVLTPEVLTWVGKLLTDTSKKQQDHTQPATLMDAQGKTIGTFEVPTLAAVLQASLDPGMGRWLGFVDRDEAPPSTAIGDVIAYVIRGVWQLDAEALGPLGNTLGSDAIVADVPDVHAAPTTQTVCDDFTGMVNQAQLGVEITRSDVIYRSLATSLSTSDVVAPAGRCEIAFSPAGLRITVPTPADRALVEVAQFNDAPFSVRAYDTAGMLLQQLVRSPGIGVLDPVTLVVTGIIRIEIVSLGPPGGITVVVGTTTGGVTTTTGGTTPAGGSTTGTGTTTGRGAARGGSPTVVTTPGATTTPPVGTPPVGTPPGTTPVPPPATTPPAGQQMVLARLCYTVTTQPPPGPSGPFVDLTVVACASVGYPPDHPAAPTIDTPVMGPWAPLTPPLAEREITLPLRGLTAGGALALAREVGGAIVGLNRRSSVGRALPLIASVPATAVEPGCGEITDRKAPPPALVYRCSQADWFGRWSGWATRPAPAGVRPMPPRPVVFASYAPPIIATPVPTAPLAGSLEVRVPVPATETLAPASNLLASVEVRATVLGVTTTGTATLPTTGALPAELIVNLSGPAVPRAENRVVSLTANWIDSAGARSIDSLPVKLTLVDPRPPDQVVLPGTLQYAARPDVTGWARAQLTWTPSGVQQRFRVFVTDETAARMRLEKMAGGTGTIAARAQAVLDALEPAAPAPVPGPVDRAGTYAANADILGRDMFEQLTASPIERPSSGAIIFEHALSGSLRLLSLYRVVAISGSNVEADFAAAPLVPIAVPNTGPPPAPLITVLPAIDPTNTVPYQAEINLVVPRGLVTAAEFRLRRSRIDARNIATMPIVATGTVPAATGGVKQELTIIDVGTSQIAPAGTLRPWVDYVWRAEVRGASEPGGGPPAEWSAPSTSVGVMLVPPDPPAMATNLTATRAAGGPATVQWKHPEPLIGGRLGSYRCELYRRVGDGPETRLVSIDAEAPATDGGRDAAGFFSYQEPTTPAPPALASYRVVVVDPIGRASAPTVAVEK